MVQQDHPGRDICGRDGPDHRPLYPRPRAEAPKGGLGELAIRRDP